MFQLPQVNLNDVLPIAGLALVAVLCVAALLVRSILHSRIALLIAVVVGVVVAGPALAIALTNIVWALVPLGVVIVVGVVAGLWVVSRNPEMIALVRDVAPRRMTYTTPPQPLLLEQGKGVVIDQPQGAGKPQAVQVRKSVTVNQDVDGWGF